MNKPLFKIFFTAFFVFLAGCTLVGQNASYKGPIYIVKDRDTLLLISKKLSVNMQDMADLNGLAPPYYVRKGQRLKVPGRNSFSMKRKQVAPAADYSEISMEPIAAVPTPSVEIAPVEIKPLEDKPLPPSITSADLPPIMQDEKPVILTEPKKEKRPLVEQEFIWPLKGKVTSNFGPRQGGIFNNGITISGREGQEAKAIADGEVMYIGSNVKGYGALIILRHYSNWVSAYSIERNNNLSKGDFVERGDVIGSIGSSSERRPELHFVLKKGKQLVDPVKFLKD